MFSIDHDDEGIRVEPVENAVATDKVMESARRVVSGEGDEDDLRRFRVEPHHPEVADEGEDGRGPRR